MCYVDPLWCFTTSFGFVLLLQKQEILGSHERLTALTNAPLSNATARRPPRQEGESPLARMGGRRSGSAAVGSLKDLLPDVEEVRGPVVGSAGTNCLSGW